MAIQNVLAVIQEKTSRGYSSIRDFLSPSQPTAAGKQRKFTVPSERILVSHGETVQDRSEQEDATPSKPASRVRDYDSVSGRDTKLYNKVLNWHRPEDVWPFRYMWALYGTATTVSALVLSRRVHHFLELRSKGWVFIALCGVLMPVSINQLFHYQFVIMPLFNSSPQRACPVCLELRSMAIQLTSSIFLPLAASTTFGMFLAPVLSTRPIPEITWEKRGNYFKYVGQAIRAARGPIAFLLASNVVFIALLSHLQFSSLGRVGREMRQRREDERLEMQVRELGSGEFAR